MAKTFAAHGASVTIAGRRRDRLESRGEGDRGRGARGRRRRDLRRGRPRAAQCEALIARAAERFGNVDGLVNNAAGNFLAFSEALTPNGFDTIVKTVLYGTVHCTLAFGRQPPARRRAPGSVVSILATYAWTGSAFVLPSACAKAGVMAMTRSLAVEWGHAGIRLNAIAPGPIPTEGAFSRLMANPAAEKAVPRAHGARPLRQARGDREPRDVPPLGPLPVPDRRRRHDGRRRVDRGRRRVLGLPQAAARDARRGVRRDEAEEEVSVESVDGVRRDAVVKRGQFFWFVWGFDALIAAIFLFFFFWGLSDGTVSSFNIVLWLGILAGLAGILGGSHRAPIERPHAARDGAAADPRDPRVSGSLVLPRGRDPAPALELRETYSAGC